MITQEKLKEILHYDPETGLFIWLKHYHPRFIGAVAGMNNKEYQYIRINKKVYLAHRLAFLYMVGEWPKNTIDHKDTDKFNNKWDNLREATYRQNMHNRGPNKRNPLGVKGVHFNKLRNVYQVQLSLGCYKSLEEAKKVYDEAAKKLHGEFFRNE